MAKCTVHTQPTNISDSKKITLQRISAIPNYLVETYRLALPGQIREMTGGDGGHLKKRNFQTMAFIGHFSISFGYICVQSCAALRRFGQRRTAYTKVAP